MNEGCDACERGNRKVQPMAKNEAMVKGSTYTLTLLSGKMVTGTYQESVKGTHILTVDGARCGVHATDVQEIGIATAKVASDDSNQ